MSLSLLLVGAGVLIALVLSIGVDAIGTALAPIGWGFVPTVLFHAVPVVLDVAAWRLLFVRGAPPLGTLAGARWIGEAVNNLLPVAQIGGEVVRVRLAAIAGADIADATASVIADVTLGALTQIAFALAGAGLLIVWFDADFAWPIVGSVLLFGCGAVGIYLLQRRRWRGRLWRLAAPLLARSGRIARLGAGGEIQRTLDALYANRAAVARACAWRLAGWIAGAGEIYLSLRFLGHPAGWIEALVLESLSQAARSAAFAVPGGLGVQEAGFLALGTILGLDPATCLALGLIRRGRDMALGLPALAAYSIVEARRSAAGRVR